MPSVKTASEELTPAQLKAASYYLMGATKRDSCRKAGLSVNYANELFDLPHVRAYIKERNKVVEQKTQMDKEWLLDKLRTIIEAEPGALLDVDAKGRPSLNWNNLSPGLRKAISKVSVDSQREGGKYKRTKTTVKIDVPDRINAIKEAAILLGLREEKTKLSAEQDLIDALNARRNEIQKEPTDEHSS